MCRAHSFCSSCITRLQNGVFNGWACIWQQWQVPEQMRFQAEGQPPSCVYTDIAAGPYSLITTAVSADLGTQSGISGEVMRTSAVGL